MKIQEHFDNFSNLNKKELIKRASNFIFSTGLNDSASQLCRENMKYGLAQFQYIQNKFGLDPKATFISTPDETISRNNYRWNSGIGYGGRINWGPGDDRIIFLNIKPNCCGLLVGGLYEDPDPKLVIERIEEIKRDELYLDDIKLEWDFYIGNHFIDIFKTKNLSDINFPPYMFVIHGSVSELRDDKYGLGLYVDKSEILKDKSKIIQTPFGSQHIIQDSDAKEYLDFQNYAINFSAKKREYIGNLIFDDFEVITNKCHQFLSDFNNFYIGCHSTEMAGVGEHFQSNLFPICLRADMPAYIFEGKKNFSYTVMKNLDFLENAEQYELIDLLLNANILPHGGGYMFPDIESVERVIEFEDIRYFLCNLKSKVNAKKIFKNPSEMQYIYRDRKVILKTLQLDLGNIVARLVPEYVIKI